MTEALAHSLRNEDGARITGAAGDITENRPAPPRWHPDHKTPFEHFLNAGQAATIADEQQRE